MPELTLLEYAASIGKTQNAVGELREQIETEHTATLWGQEYKITPRLISHVFGDGQKLMYLQPLMIRPFYFVAMVGSKTDYDSEGFPDLLDEIKQEAESEFPEICYFDEESEQLGESHFNGGCSWGDYKP